MHGFDAICGLNLAFSFFLKKGAFFFGARFFFTHTFLCPMISSPSSLVVRGVAFEGKGMDGDFAWMIKNPLYSSTIFVFNDNVVDGADVKPHDGAGSAAIRTMSWKYSLASETPRALGVPTGWSSSTGGFRVEGDGLEPFAARAITLSFERLVLACVQHDVRQVIYSCDKGDPMCRRLGCGTFALEPAVLRFIERRLDELSVRVREGSKFTLDRINELEAQIAHVGRLHEQLSRRASFGASSFMKPSTSDVVKRRLVVQMQRLSAAEEESKSLRHVGAMQDGKQVYETLNDSVKRPRLFHQGPLVLK